MTAKQKRRKGEENKMEQRKMGNQSGCKRKKGLTQKRGEDCFHNVVDVDLFVLPQTT